MTNKSNNLYANQKPHIVVLAFSEAAQRSNGGWDANVAGKPDKFTARWDVDQDHEMRSSYLTRFADATFKTVKASDVRDVGADTRKQQRNSALDFLDQPRGKGFRPKRKGPR